MLIFWKRSPEVENLVYELGRDINKGMWAEWNILILQLRAADAQTEEGKTVIQEASAKAAEATGGFIPAATIETMISGAAAAELALIIPPPPPELVIEPLTWKHAVGLVADKLEYNADLKEKMLIFWARDVEVTMLVYKIAEQIQAGDITVFDNILRLRVLDAQTKEGKEVIHEAAAKAAEATGGFIPAATIETMISGGVSIEAASNIEEAAAGVGEVAAGAGGAIAAAAEKTGEIIVKEAEKANPFATAPTPTDAEANSTYEYNVKTILSYLGYPDKGKDLTKALESWKHLKKEVWVIVWYYKNDYKVAAAERVATLGLISLYDAIIPDAPWPSDAEAEKTFEANTKAIIKTLGLPATDVPGALEGWKNIKKEVWRVVWYYNNDYPHFAAAYIAYLGLASLVQAAESLIPWGAILAIGAIGLIIMLRK